MPTSNSAWGLPTTATTVAATFPESIKNRTILITGVNRSGLGYTTASAFDSQSPSTIIITGRSHAKLTESADALRTEYPSVTIKPLHLDLSSQASVREAAPTLLAWDDVPAIDIVVNNAGIMNLPSRTLSVDGVEMHFATNHILVGTNKRIVNMSSVATFVSPVRFSDLRWETPHRDIPEYFPFGAYGRSKTANILHAVGLNKAVGKKGLVSFAVHPGEIKTELHRSTDQKWLAKAMEARKQAGQGGRLPGQREGSGYALDQEAAEKLWKVSEELVGEKFAW
ncbi:NAD(P)-binding protein [Bimuria novae-zelandiae CBS 107.79]|uniref:NAD(P)-binding protein n=1 Tax=Bimuria novae-zelandiae CBS 107.79 TaxID=1447943 RepID=A0A6A5VDX2_9PLEO|nr:NAD(P)-binding protein [Bimuria novae-zelandiae CBS 107.79]